METSGDASLPDEFLCRFAIEGTMGLCPKPRQGDDPPAPCTSLRAGFNHLKHTTRMRVVQ